MRTIEKIRTKAQKRQAGEINEPGRSRKKTQPRGKSRRHQWEEI